MIGRRQLPAAYQEWNRKWGAPHGHLAFRAPVTWLSQYESVTRAMQDLSVLAGPDYGPFALQPASQTRAFEYPWAFLAARLEPGLRVLEVGGGVGGLQFVLDQEGCEVVNADPAFAAESSPPGYARLTPELHHRLNGVFGTGVTLLPTRVQDAGLAPESFHRAFCISVLEHLDPAEARDVLRTVAGTIRPDGLILLSVDLFLDLKPFGVLETNVWGRNHDVWELVHGAGLELVEGDPRELLGSPEFDQDHVVASLPELLVAEYPVMTQVMVLRPASRSGAPPAAGR